MDDFVIVVQGQSNFVKEIKECWKGYPIIFSTWKGEEKKYEEQDLCLFLDIPQTKGPHNLNLQRISTIEGLLEAKRLGYKKAIKWRSDMICNNSKELLKLFKKDLNFLFWHQWNEGYVCDYFMGGNIKELLLLWDFSLFDDWKYPEQAITKQLLSNKNYFKSYYFFGNQLSTNNDIFWLKNNIRLSSYIQDPKFLCNPLI